MKKIEVTDIIFYSHDDTPFLHMFNIEGLVVKNGNNYNINNIKFNVFKNVFENVALNEFAGDISIKLNSIKTMSVNIKEI